MTDLEEAQLCGELTERLQVELEEQAKIKSMLNEML